ncbi:MAG: type III PLP-dependent enzyme [Alphaproteobacteria bacterium]|nr:type III PLP-dependent enzyme [Alphaproteobacteria bacterium]
MTVPATTLTPLAALPRFASTPKAIEALKPQTPLYLLHPEKFAAAAKTFLEGFPGDVLYAVKANPHPYALQLLWEGGIRHFDSASLGEIETVKALLPEAICHFMAPVRLAGQAKAAFSRHGVTDYVIDSAGELEKLLAETGEPKRLRIFVRLVASLGGALLEMSSKYGCRPEEAAKLLKRVKAAGAQPCLTFHVGSQCLSPFSYAQAIEIAQQALRQSGVTIAALDIGGGFPTAYSGQEPPPYHWFFDMIRTALDNLALPNLNVMCEPGRALCGQGISLVTQVLMRRGDKLYLNDGIYGSFDEQRFAGFDEDYPPTGFTLDARGRLKELSGENRPFRAYGPTCDSADVLPRPVLLPDSVKDGDYVLFGAMGAYTVSSRSAFNGYYPDSWAVIA